MVSAPEDNLSSSYMNYNREIPQSESRSSSNNGFSHAELVLKPLTPCRERPIAFKLSQTLKNVKQSIKRRKDSVFDFDKYEDEKPPELRHIPENLETLCLETGMEKSQMRFLYRAFKKECPNGAITEITFRNIYCQMFPVGDGNAYAHYLFKALDDEQSGSLTFGKFVRGFATLVNGSMRDKLHFIFRLYDIDHDGTISKKELSAVVSAIHNLLGPSEAYSEKHADLVFRKFDLNCDGVITIDEFIAYCFNNESICRSFSIFEGW